MKVTNDKLAAKRLEQTLEIVRQRSFVTIQELCDSLGVSSATVHRDLNILANLQQLRKIHGGASSLDNHIITHDVAFSSRIDQNPMEKKAIAQAAAQLIEPDDFVYVDGGTTTLALAELVVNNGASFVVNSLEHAQILVSKGCPTFLLGGEIKGITGVVIGSVAYKQLEGYNFSKGFFGTNGITLENGCTTPEFHEAGVKEKALSRCRQSYLLADSSKFDKAFSVTFAGLDQVEIITSNLNPKYAQSPKVRFIDVKQTHRKEMA